MTLTTTLRSIALTLAAALVVGVPAILQAQVAAAPVRISANEIDAHLRFLASDLLEGRAPATRGGRLTAEYIASQLRAYGYGLVQAQAAYKRIKQEGCGN